MPQSTTLDDLQDLIASARTAVTQARELAYAPRAWQLLNADNPSHQYQPAAWTENAIACLDEGREALPDDTALLHHAAIAHHARAWDLELQQAPEAEERWREALALWRALHARSDFWQQMRDTAAAMQPPVEAEAIDAIRDRVYDDLMAVHVSFVRFYCDRGQTDRAHQHIRLIRETRLPPAVRRQMPGLLFDAMTGSVPDLVARRHCGEAVAVLERYLRLYEDHLPALRLMLQVCRDWAINTSQKDDWELICSVSRRARPWAERLVAHPDFDAEPLAKLDLIRLCECMATRHYRKLDEMIEDDELVPTPVPQEHLQWMDDALYWIRTLHQQEPNRPHAVQLANILLLAMNIHAAAGEIDRALAEQDERQQIMDRYPG